MNFNNLAELQILQRDNNQLNGSLPEQLGNAVSSPEVSTGGNSFSGPIPSTFDTQMVYLENSNFSQNLLSGSIPPSIFSLKMLQILDLHGNSLNQSIPWNRTQLTALQIPLRYDPGIPSVMPVAGGCLTMKNECDARLFFHDAWLFLLT